MAFDAEILLLMAGTLRMPSDSADRVKFPEYPSEQPHAVELEEWRKHWVASLSKSDLGAVSKGLEPHSLVGLSEKADLSDCVERAAKEDESARDECSVRRQNAQAAKTGQRSSQRPTRPLRPLQQPCNCWQVCLLMQHGPDASKMWSFSWSPSSTAQSRRSDCCAEDQHFCESALRKRLGNTIIACADNGAPLFAAPRRR
jgi:hypothetical protein